MGELGRVCSRENFFRVHPTGKVHVAAVEIRGRGTSLPVSVLLDGGEGDEDAEGHLIRFALDDKADWRAILALNIAASPTIRAQNTLVQVYVSGRAARLHTSAPGARAATSGLPGPRRVSYVTSA